MWIVVYGARKAFTAALIGLGMDGHDATMAARSVRSAGGADGLHGVNGGVNGFFVSRIPFLFNGLLFSAPSSTSWGSLVRAQCRPEVARLVKRW